MGRVGVQARAPTHPSSSSQPAYQRCKKPRPRGTLPVSEQTKGRSINCNTIALKAPSSFFLKRGDCELIGLMHLHLAENQDI